MNGCRERTMRCQGFGRRILDGSHVKVVIQKPDLDTCLTGLILGVKEDDAISTAFENAPVELLSDPKVFCIEAGGSGQVHLNNFDHHDPGLNLPAASRQAYAAMRVCHEKLDRLVRYVEMIDGCAPRPPQREGLIGLSSIFSGMMHCIQNMRAQFVEGIGMLNTVLEQDIDPFGNIPLIPQWKRYYVAWLKNRMHLAQVLKSIEIFDTNGGRRGGFLDNPGVGGLGCLYAKGCDIGILSCSSFGPGRVQKYTIGSTGLNIGILILSLNTVEPGWGGRSTIIGSPRRGSLLSPEFIIETVVKIF
jgi:hypothetical protein